MWVCISLPISEFHLFIIWHILFQYISLHLSPAHRTIFKIHPCISAIWSQSIPFHHTCTSTHGLEFLKHLLFYQARSRWEDIYLKNRRLNFNAEIAKLKRVGCKIPCDSSWSQMHLCGIMFAFVGDFQWSRLIVSLACLSQDWPQKYFLPPVLVYKCVHAPLGHTPPSPSMTLNEQGVSLCCLGPTLSCIAVQGSDFAGTVSPPYHQHPQCRPGSKQVRYRAATGAVTGEQNGGGVMKILAVIFWREKARLP